MRIHTKYNIQRPARILSALFMLSSLMLFSQKTNPDTGKVQIIRDERVDQLVQKHVQFNQTLNGMEGFRIQIFFDSGTNSKTRARSIYESFLVKYPDVGAYLSFKSPNYKVRVGDFRTRLDAQRFLNEILPEYPNAWIIEDQINLPKVEP